MRKAMSFVVASLAIGVLGVAPAARAGDYFVLNAAGGSGATASQSGSSILKLVDNLINTKSDFAPLIGQGFNASLSYGGVPNALLFSQNAAQTSVTLTIPSTGFTQTFTGTSPGDVQDQIRDFIKKNGAGEYAAFTKAIDQQSAVAAVDGNPQAFTEFLATDAFTRFGLNPTLSQSSMEAEPTSHGGIRVDLAGGFSHAGGLDGYDAELSLGSDVRFSDFVALSFGTALQYRSVAGSQTYFVGQEIGLPISIIHQRPDNGFAWQVTPWGFGGIGGSTDQANGAVLVGGGGTSSLSYQYESLVFTLADQISYASGIPVGIEGFHFDTDVNQWILKNGVKVGYAPGKGPFFIEGGISYSNILHHAAIPDYWTPELGVGFKFGKFSGIKLSYEGNFASKYSENGGRLTVYFAY